MDGEEFAPAKVNLFLHVSAPRSDGFHPIRSLMVFANIGDRLALTPADRLDFRIDGEFAEGLSATDDNLVVRARDALLALAGEPAPPFRLSLTKNLPVASGLGGGSADAAAALRLMARSAVREPSESQLIAVAEALGSDVPACLAARSVIAEGRGEILSLAPRLPTLDAVLVNPLVASPTATVFRAFDTFGAAPTLDAPPLPPRFWTVNDLVEFLRTCRNDLEGPAAGITPVIAASLHDLRRREETLIARLSGSGATAFALCADQSAAEALARRLADDHPRWWIRACRLGDPAVK